MSNTAVKTKQEPGMGRLALILFGISAVCALLLGLVNLITVGPIQQAQQAKQERAMAEVLPAQRYDPVDYSGGPGSLVTAVYRAGDAGYVVQVGPSGFGGVIDMMVGVDQDGNVTGISFVKMSETSGLGMNAQKDSFKDQFSDPEHQTGSFSVTKDGGQIDALTGATITSRAVADGVNAALDAVKTLG